MTCQRRRLWSASVYRARMSGATALARLAFEDNFMCLEALSGFLACVATEDPVIQIRNMLLLKEERLK
jgi:hypothetical protein